MEIRAPETIFTGVKAERGLFSDSGAYISRANTFALDPALLQIIGSVELKAGEETPVAVAVPGLPLNANIQNITATLTVISADAGAQATSVGIADGNEAPRNIKVSVDAAAGIRNVQVRLNKGPAFWSHSGLLPVSSTPVVIPDFSEQANAYLDKFQSKDGKVTLQFMVKSDLAGTVRIDIQSELLTYTLLKTQSWQNPLDSTVRVDRTLNVIFNQIATLPIDPVSPPAGRQVQVSFIHLDAGGKFSADRLLGPVEVHDGRDYATVGQDFSVAQNVIFKKNIFKTAIQSTGVAGYFEAEVKAEFYIEFQNDQFGSPASGAPLATANVSFVPADKGDPQAWTFARFQKQTELKPDTPYWIVAKGVHGSVRMGLRTSPSPNANAAVARGGLLLNRGGQIWKPLTNVVSPPMEALLSLIYVPQTDNQTAAIGISVGGATQQIDPQASAKTIAFPIATAFSGTPVLMIESRAIGSLTVANVIQEYHLA
jgi:hypothetical protein